MAPYQYFTKPVRPTTTPTHSCSTPHQNIPKPHLMDFEMVGKKSGQIPAFGNWDTANDLPITQYFETARQAGLLRFPTAPAAAHRHRHRHQYYSGGGVNGYSYNDLYAADFQRPPIRVLHVAPHHRQAGHGDEEYPRRRRQQRTYDDHMVDHHRTRRSSQQQPFHTDHYSSTKKQFPRHHSAIADVRKSPHTVTNTVKPVDEDLYKIPPELLLHHNSKGKRMLGFFFRCLVPPCSA